MDLKLHTEDMQYTFQLKFSFLIHGFRDLITISEQTI